MAEMERRRDKRCQELQEQQEKMIYDALEMLGRWWKANDIQLHHRFKDLNTPVQVPLETPPEMRRQIRNKSHKS